MFPLFPHLPMRRAKGDPDGDDDDDGNDEHAKQESDSENEEKNEEQNLLMNFRFRFESTLREPNRMLVVRDLVVSFDPASIYGQRSGFLKGLLITVTLLQQIAHRLDNE